jgi:hypothetical protein
LRAPVSSHLARILFLASLAAIFPAGAAAFTISVAPAQDPAYPAEGEENPTPIGALVSGCLDVFFDAGMIATDARSERIPREEWQAPSFGLGAARDGLVEYSLALYPAWKPSVYRKGAWLLSFVEYRLVRVSDGTVVSVGALEGLKDSEKVAREVDRSVSSIGASVASTCIEVLDSRLVGGK